MADRPSTSNSRSLTAVANRLRTPVYVSDRAMPEEQETIRNIEGMLQLATISGQSEEAFVAANLGPDGLCSDPNFQPSLSSLYPDPHQPPASAIQNLSWRRVSGALYLPTGRTPKLLQGIMNNQGFLGALAAVAVKNDQGLLLDLIISDNHAQEGAYTFQFYKHGCWHPVTVDNYLPCMDVEDRLAFACSGNVGELWPSFVEKAYAKMHGSYFALEGCSVHEALVDLTGGVVSKVDLASELQGTTHAAMWDQVCRWLSAGSIVACQAKRKGVSLDDASQETSGLLPNHVYSVIDARQVDTSTRLLRLHCPWPSGLWTGPWSSGSGEWGSRLTPAQLQQFAPTLADDGTFWISLGSFLEFFNRAYVCRLFAPTWHQLTLHCGWQGPSAGGPYYTPVAITPDGETHMGMSSTWCCNPQFRLTVRKACEVVVCLSQQDPMIVNRGHVRKALRRRAIGMQVLSVSLSTYGRRWEVRSSELMMEVALSAGREVTATFRAEPDHAYVVVPYAGRAGEEGAFVLRTFSGSPVEVEQLPSPLSLVLGGHWVGFLAGGPRTCTSFGSNPQYMISASQRAQVVLSAVRLDVKYAILKPPRAEEQCVGLCLLEPGVAGGGLTRRDAVQSDSQVYAESGFASMEEAVLTCALEADTPYVVVPSLNSPGIEAPFELRIMSSVPVELVPLPEVKAVVLRGEWSEGSAGGCDLHPLWKKNPRYLLALQQNAKVKITLSKLRPANGKRGGKVTSSVDDMIGFYVLRATESSGEVKGDLRKAVLSETTFVTTADNSMELDLQAGTPYVVIPCTYSPGRLGKFMLGFACETDFDALELQA